MNIIHPHIIDIDAHPPLGSIHSDYIGELDSDLFFSRMNRAGVESVCATLRPPKGFFEEFGPAEAIRRLNQAALRLSASHPAYIPALHIHPDCPDASCEEMGHYSSLGLRLIEFDADWIGLPQTADLLSEAARLNLPVSLRRETPEQTADLAGRFPGLRLIAGGYTGRGYMPAHTHELLSRFPGIYLNLSGMIWSCNYVLHEWAERFPSDRLLFGTGYPDTNPASKTAAVLWELRDHPAEITDRILRKNAQMLLGTKE